VSLNLKKISPDAIERALELGERYRLLNEPEEAASICRDVLEADPGNQDATRMLLLSLTDQFGKRRGASCQEAETIADMLKGEYDGAYYRGVIFERWGRCKLQEGAPAYVAGEWLQRAMALYEEAEQHRPAGDDSAILRWNACARLMQRYPEMMADSPAQEMQFGD
jgi:hypothetical protein